MKEGKNSMYKKESNEESYFLFLWINKAIKDTVNNDKTMNE